MKTIWLVKIFALLLFLTSFCFVYSSAQTVDKKQNVLIATQKEFFETIKSKKYEILDNILDNDYIGTYSLGIIDKAKEKKDLRNFNLTDYQMSDIHVALPNSQTGIISFKLHVEVSVEGKKLAEDDFVNCVWKRKGKKWLLSAQTAVKVGNNT